MNRIMSYLKRFISPVLKQFKTSVPFMIALVLLLLVIAIWWIGPTWTVAGSKPLGTLLARITATVVVFVIPLLYWTFSTRRKYQKLNSERKHDEAIERDPSIPYVQAQNRQLDENLTALKANDMSSNFLYKMPWYLVLGQEGSGKTSLVNRSNQSFSLTSVVRAGARKNSKDPYLAYSVDWWVGNEAVLIDPPGEIISQSEAYNLGGVTQAQDNSIIPSEGDEGKEKSAAAGMFPSGLGGRLWTGLLDWLAKNRSNRPLNGIILTIDLPSLLNQTPSDRKAMAVLLRTRLFELSQKLGTRLPLYVVLTKFDLVDGFAEFFSKLPRSVREDIFGFTFTLDSIDNYDLWLGEFMKEYDNLIEKINEQIFDDLGQPHTLTERESLFSFIAQLAGIRDMLINYLTEMLGSDNYSTPALVRGVYFSSVYQQGLLSNAFINEAANTYKLSRLIPQAKESSQGTIYFAQKLFKDIIYPEAGLAGDNIKVIRQKRRIFVANSAVAVAACVLAVGGWHYYFAENRAKANEVLVTTQEFTLYDIDSNIDRTGKNLLPPLNQIRQAVNIFGDHHTAWPVVADMGLYEGKKIGPRVDEAYLHLLSNRFLPALSIGLVETMDSAKEGSDEQLAALRVYRMINDLDNRRPEVVERWMARTWQAAYPNDGNVQERLMWHLKYAMQHAEADLPQYEGKIAHTQQILGQIPPQQRVYMGMKSTARNVLVRPLDLRNEVGPSFDLVFTPIVSATSNQPSSNIHNVVYDSTSQPLLLDALFTAKGFRDYFDPSSQDAADLAKVDEWVLGQKGTIYYSENDKKVMVARINDYYITDYINIWKRSLNQFEVTDFKDIQHGVAVLDTILGSAAPFRRLLETVKENSEIYAPVSASGVLAEGAGSTPEESTKIVAAAAQKLEFPPGSLQESSLRVTRTFASLSMMLEARNGEPSSYEDVMTTVAAVYEYLKAVHDSPDRGKMALQLVLDRFELKGADPISNLQRMAAGLPDPMSRHITKLAQQAEYVLMVEALRELEKRWDVEVYRIYAQDLAPRYPFNPASRQDVSLDDFEKFFGPEGTLQTFTDKYLNVFLRDNINALYLQGQERYLVRTDVFDQLKAANRIRDTFFNSRGALNVEFTIQPLGMLQSTRSSMLSVDGQQLIYRHGPAVSTGLMWPNTLSQAAESKLVLVNAKGGSAVISAKGPWSLFRLLSQAQLASAATGSQVELSFTVGGGNIKYRITSDKANNPFTGKVFQGFSLPRTLLSSEYTRKEQ